jgi:alpha-L-rhamnosidase
MRPPLLAVLAILAVANIALAADSPATVAELTAEHAVNPIGIGVAQPRLSWKLLSDVPGQAQTAYEIRAASSVAALAGTPNLWNSGKVVSDQSVLVRWAGEPLDSRSRVYWQVRVWDKNDQATDWSAPAYIELGLLNSKSEWKGQWITADLPRFDIVQAPLANAMWINAGSTARRFGRW